MSETFLQTSSLPRTPEDARAFLAPAPGPEAPVSPETSIGPEEARRILLGSMVVKTEVKDTSHEKSGGWAALRGAVEQVTDLARHNGGPIARATMLDTYGLALRGRLPGVTDAAERRLYGVAFSVLAGAGSREQGEVFLADAVGTMGAAELSPEDRTVLGGLQSVKPPLPNAPHASPLHTAAEQKAAIDEVLHTFDAKNPAVRQLALGYAVGLTAANPEIASGYLEALPASPLGNSQKS